MSARSTSLLVVTRRDTGLYEYLRRSLAGYPGVQVVLDRRRTERRQTAAAVALERRRAPDRRARPGIEDDLRGRGCALVR